MASSAAGRDGSALHKSLLLTQEARFPLTSQFPKDSLLLPQCVSFCLAEKMRIASSFSAAVQLEAGTASEAKPAPARAPVSAGSHEALLAALRAGIIAGVHGGPNEVTCPSLGTDCPRQGLGITCKCSGSKRD